MKNRVVALAVVFLTSVAWPTTGRSQAEPAEATMPTPSANPWGWNFLGLTADQMTRVQQIVAEWQTELTPVWTELQSKNMELQRLMMDPSAEPSVVAEKTKAMGEAQAEIQRKNLERRNAVRDVLTDEQKVLFDQQGLGSGWGSGPCGLGLGVGWSGGLGRGRGRGRGPGRGFGRAGGWGAGGPGSPGAMPGRTAPGVGRGMGMTQGVAPGLGMPGLPAAGVGWGRGPCGMGMGRAQMNSWNRMGRRRW